ncbi:MULTISPECIES: hypothetical protein [Halomonadaceae]|uniref:hypothetical protein n=1 Tax=Halomonadaceae TaxID=28256 RepID=UPI00159A69C8|nr:MULTISPECIES: hypothetical protein [Halomonas]QJQ93955.1 hypothetical protein HIO72_00680 [Halomonas sp. PA5]
MNELECRTCGEKWPGTYTCEHRCTVCGTRVTAKASSAADRLEATEHQRLKMDLASALGHDAENPSMCDLVAIARLVVKERDAALKRADREATGFRAMCEAWQRLEEIVGLDTGGGMGPAPALNAVEHILRERLALAAHVEAVADALGFPPHNENRHRTSVIVTNIENMRRFADYLHSIENAFLMIPGEPDADYPDEDPEPECMVSSWGARSREHYVEQFRQALAHLKAQWQAEALESAAEDSIDTSTQLWLKARARHYRRRQAQGGNHE